MTQVFISYRHEPDGPFANRLREELLAWGCRPWMDAYDIPKGAYWPDEIDKGLTSSDVVIGLISEKTFDSRNVKNEWDWALDNHKPLIPVLLKKPENTPHRYTSINYIDFRDETQGFAQLKNELARPSTRYREDAIVSDEPKKPARTKTEAINRGRMLQKVYDFWVVGVLDNALKESGTFELGLDIAPGSVLKHVDYGEYELPTTANILDTFNDMNHELLILGARGAGKTILLLQLARDLIDQAQKDEKRAIPVVFNLSSWAAEHKSLAEWLVDELRTKYQVPKKVARNWVEWEQLLLLLDGLDEVSSDYRDACVESINEFRRKYTDIDLALCSRIEEYDKLKKKLNVRGAIVLQPLTKQQIDGYIVADDLSGLREVMQSDATLRQMTGIPFLLNTMVFAYRGASVVSLKLPVSDDAGKSRRTHLFEAYVERRLRTHIPHTSRSGRERQYIPRLVRHYLAWLAKTMVERNQTVFYIEGLQLDWLGKPWQRYLYILVSRVVFGLVIGGLASGLALVVIVGLNSMLSHKEPVFGLLGGGSVFGIVAILHAGLNGLVFGGMATGLLFGFAGVLNVANAVAQAKSGGFVYKLMNGLRNILTLGVVFGLIGFLVGILLGVMFLLLSSGNLSVEVPTGNPLSGMKTVLTIGLYGGVIGAASGIVAGTLAAVRIKINRLTYGLYAGAVTMIALVVIFGVDEIVLAVLYIVVPDLIVVVLFSILVGGTNDEIRSAENLRWSWRWRWFAIGLAIGSAIGLAIGLLTEISVSLLHVSLGIERLIFDMIFGGLLGGLSGGVVGGLRKSESVETRIRPNQGIQRSVHNTLKAGLILGVVGTLASALLILLNAVWDNLIYHVDVDTDILVHDLGARLVFGLAVGLAIGLIFGGSDAVAKHGVLRLLLYRSGHIPLNYARFLDYAASIGLLRKVGGGYIFVHRYLLEYFAELE